ncbi:hypothetical protein IAU60_003454 [Kwoniella sp. DSM 27419]
MSAANDSNDLEQHLSASSSHLASSLSPTDSQSEPSFLQRHDQSARTKPKQTKPGDIAVQSPTGEGQVTTPQTNTRRSARLSLTAITSADLLSSSTGGKGKKRVNIEETPQSTISKKSRTSVQDSPYAAPIDFTASPSDLKGKKKAAPPSTSPQYETTSLGLDPAIKRTKRTSAASASVASRYHLRRKSEEDTTQTAETSAKAKGKGKASVLQKQGKPDMPKKTDGKAKRPGAVASNDRTKKGDTSARHLVGNQIDDDDSLWLDAPGGSRSRPFDDDDEDDHMGGFDHDEDEDEEDDEENNVSEAGGAASTSANPFERLSRLASETGLNLDDATAAALFGGGFRAFGGMMSSLSTRFKRLKGNLRSKNIATRLAALRECSELLLVSNEDTLGGAFSPATFTTEFVAILNGKPNIDDKDDDEGQQPAIDEMDEDAQLAAALALSSGGMMPSMTGDEDDMECQLLACRCLAHLMEALPGSGHTLVNCGAIPVLCSKLTEISYIELAEQTLSTLEKVSAEYPAAIVREGGLGALLNYLPFFSTNVQRTAVTAAANCCRNISGEHYAQIKEVFPILRDTLSSGDQRLVEQATLAVVRTIEAYRHNASHLEGLLEVPTIAAINALLMPSGGSPLISTSTYTHLLRALTSAARGSAKVSLAFLEAGMTNTVYQILTGVLPPSHDEDEQGNSSGGQGLAGGVADMAVLQNLAHRPKDQVEEALALICELLPPTPRDGIFDQKMYTEKSLNRVKRGRNPDRSSRSDKPRRSSRVAEGASGTSTGPSTPSGPTVPLPADTPTPVNHNAAREAALLNAKKDVEKQMQDRLELLSSHPELIGRFIKALVPVLVDVYAASVVQRVRTKVLTGLNRAIAFAGTDQLMITLKSVPMASFLCAIISSKDDSTFVLQALQLVELLATKLPEVYQASFLREGVVFEIDVLASTEMTKEKAAKEAAEIKDDSEELIPAQAGSTAVGLPPIPDDLRPLLSLSGLTGNISLGGDTPARPASPKRSSNSYLDPSDANIVRARMLQAKKVFDAGGDHHSTATKVLDEISESVQKLCRVEASEGELRDILRTVASRFADGDQALSSYELLKSGLVDGLLEFVDVDGSVDTPSRRAMLFDIFSDTSLTHPSPLTVLVKRLHESLGRLESFDVEVAFGGNTDSSRLSSGLSKTIRIKLQAEDGQEVPKQVSTLSLTIQAIAPMQAIHDYLRPRVADANYGSGLSRMFAAYAAGMPGGAGSATSRLLSALAAGPPSTARNPTAPPETASNAAITGTGSGAQASEEKEAAAEDTAGKPQRRRSARLSANETNEGSTSAVASGSASVPVPQPVPSPITATAESAGAPGPTILPAMPLGMDFDDDYSDEEYDAEVFDEDLEEEITRPTESIVNMSVAADGSRVEAKTPDGTRIATPQHNAPGSNMASSGSGADTPRGSSYAGAVKTAPNDWHLQFAIGGQPLSLRDTVYGAVHRNKSSLPDAGGFVGAYGSAVTITYKKVEGPAQNDGLADAPSPGSAGSAFPTGLETNGVTSKILRLLRVVHNLSVEGREVYGRPDTSMNENLFVNNKLTAKLTRQLEETMILASDCLPEWAIELPKHFSFLFPFETRYNFLQSTAFGYGRLIARWQAANPSRNGRDDVAHLARLVRQKVRISRSQLLESCAKVLELYGTSTGILEIEYFDEIGTGLGPTLEFYSLASKEFAKRSLGLWRDEDENKEGDYVYHPRGLYPAPIAAVEGDAVKAKLGWYKTLGLFTGRALLDTRIIDVSLNRVFLKLILGVPVKKSIATLRAVDPTLARSLERLQSYMFSRKEIEALKLPVSSRRSKLAALTVGGAKLADLSLDFTLPGYDIELKPRGSHIDVDDSNLEEYLERVLEMTLGSGVAQQVKAFQAGFSMVFPIQDMRIFSPDELGLLFGNADEDWSRETLEQALKADHGYNLDSRSVQNLVEIMTTYDKQERRQFLQFITGAPKLPIGGFKGLTPPFTVVRKPHEPPFKADDYLPSVMTCAQYLKLPDYSTKEVLAAQIQRAMLDGGGSFHLS